MSCQPATSTVTHTNPFAARSLVSGILAWRALPFAAHLSWF